MKIKIKMKLPIKIIIWKLNLIIKISKLCNNIERQYTIKISINYNIMNYPRFISNKEYNSYLNYNNHY